MFCFGKGVSAVGDSNCCGTWAVAFLGVGYLVFSDFLGTDPTNPIILLLDA